MKFCIVGTSRSGSTLLRHMLNLHPRLGVFNETHWIPKMFESFGTQRISWKLLLDIAEKTTWDTGEDLFSVHAKLADSFTREEILREFRLRLSEKGEITIQEFSDILAGILFSDKPEWADKTPDYGYYMNLLQELWPECRFINVVRGGLATARSLSKHSGCMLMTSNGFDNWCWLSYDKLYEKYEIRNLGLEVYVKAWRRRLYRIRDEAKRLTPGTYMEVGYETLLSDPKRVLANVTEYLDLELNSDWFTSCQHLIRPPLPVVIDKFLLAQMDSLELIALNEFNEVPYFLLDAKAAMTTVQRFVGEGESQLAKGNKYFALRVAISVLATESGAAIAEILEAALTLRDAALPGVIAESSLDES